MKKRNSVALAIATLGLFAILGLSGCYFSGVGSRGSAAVALDISAKQLPGTPTSLTLTVSAPDMAPLSTSFPASSKSMSLEVPAGPDRTFSLTIEVSSADSAATAFTGETTVDIPIGREIEVLLNMLVSATKLVVPDYLGYKVIQMDDISGAGWLELLDGDADLAAIGFSAGDLRPYDIDFDAKGRIYVANNVGFGLNNAVLRIDDITGKNAWLLPSPAAGGGVVALTIDRARDIVYFATSGPVGLYRSALDGSGQTSLTINAGVEGITGIRGMAVDADGMLFVAGDSGAATVQPRVFHYNPTTQLVEASYASAKLALANPPWDVLVKEPHIYVANRGGLDGYQILRLNRDFTNPIGYGINAPVLPDTSPGSFYGPTRFVATLNKKITLIDDVDFNHKVVSFDDILGTNWETYPTSGSGTAFFTFYFC